MGGRDGSDDDTTDIGFVGFGLVGRLMMMGPEFAGAFVGCS